MTDLELRFEVVFREAGAAGISLDAHLLDIFKQSDDTGIDSGQVHPVFGCAISFLVSHYKSNT